MTSNSRECWHISYKYSTVVGGEFSRGQAEVTAAKHTAIALIASSTHGSLIQDRQAASK